MPNGGRLFGGDLSPPMKRRPSFWHQVWIYALLLALAAFGLQWLQYHYLLRSLSTEAYIIAIAVAFVALGGWLGYRLTPTAASEPFRSNEPAIEQLGLSTRELEVLRLLASGQSNKEMARVLHLSPNTVKTHLANLYAKLDASRRTQAIAKARALAIIP